MNKMEDVQMNIADIILKGIMKCGLDKKMWETSQAIKKEADLPEQDWNRYIQERTLYPTEVQTVIEYTGNYIGMCVLSVPDSCIFNGIACIIGGIYYRGSNKR